jgi:hypothetical protein
MTAQARPLGERAAARRRKYDETIGYSLIFDRLTNVARLLADRISRSRIWLYSIDKRCQSPVQPPSVRYYHQVPPVASFGGSGNTAPGGSSESRRGDGKLFG